MVYSDQERSKPFQIQDETGFLSHSVTGVLTLVTRRNNTAILQTETALSKKKTFVHQFDSMLICIVVSHAFVTLHLPDDLFVPLQLPKRLLSLTDILFSTFFEKQILKSTQQPKVMGHSGS